MHTIWTDLIVPGVPVAEKLIRTLAVYVFLLVGLRLAGKRELGQLNPFDLVVLFLLSNTVQYAIIGSDNSLSGGIIGAALLLVINYVVVRYLYEHPALDRFIAGDTELLIRGGRVLEHRLRRELITREELAAAARRQGFSHLNEIESCRLEVGGALTFVPKRPTTDDERHRDVMARLEKIEKMVRASQ
jgi:uncharacterized membrane protein YcaP (DUF421 family)